MGHYISIQLKIDESKDGLLPFQSFFEMEHFKPKCIGGIGSSVRENNRWLLYGYGLESFVCQYAWRDRGKLPSITSMNQDDNDYECYMNGLISFIKNKTVPSKDFSKYEYLMEEYGITLLQAPMLNQSSLKNISDWVNNCDSSSLTLSGSFAISTSHATHIEWGNAFRFLVEEPTEFIPIAIPLVMISYNPQVHILSIKSESKIWLYRNESGALIDEAAADSNLGRLRCMVDQIHNDHREITSMEITTKGKDFKYEKERLENILGCNIVAN